MRSWRKTIGGTPDLLFMLFAATMSTSVVSGNSNNQTESREFPALASHIFVAVSFCHTLVSKLTRWSFSPFILLHPVASYLVSPLRVFVAMIANLCLITPLSTTRYILNSLYPIYVFCGVACITGIAVGVGGRGICAFLIRMLATQEGSAPANAPTTPRGNVNERRDRRRRLRMREEDT